MHTASQEIDEHKARAKALHKRPEAAVTEKICRGGAHGFYPGHRPNAWSRAATRHRRPPSRRDCKLTFSSPRLSVSGFQNPNRLRRRYAPVDNSLWKWLPLGGRTPRSSMQRRLGHHRACGEGRTRIEGQSVRPLRAGPASNGSYDFPGGGFTSIDVTLILSPFAWFLFNKTASSFLARPSDSFRAASGLSA